MYKTLTVDLDNSTLLLIALLSMLRVWNNKAYVKWVSKQCLCATSEKYKPKMIRAKVQATAQDWGRQTPRVIESRSKFAFAETEERVSRILLHVALAEDKSRTPRHMQEMPSQTQHSRHT